MFTNDQISFLYFFKLISWVVIPKNPFYFLKINLKLKQKLDLIIMIKDLLISSIVNKIPLPGVF